MIPQGCVPRTLYGEYYCLGGSRVSVSIVRSRFVVAARSHRGFEAFGAPVVRSRTQIPGQKVEERKEARISVGRGPELRKVSVKRRAGEGGQRASGMCAVISIPRTGSRWNEPGRWTSVER